VPLQPVARLGAAQEAVRESACVNVRSGDRPRRVDAQGEGGGRARSIEAGEGAVASAQKAVSSAWVNVPSADRPSWVYAQVEDEDRAPRRIEGGEGAVASAQEAVISVRVVRSRDAPAGLMLEP
jgi:hypothetical protein